MEFSYNCPVVSEYKSFENVDGRTIKVRGTTEPAYTISYPGAFGLGELNYLVLIVVVLLIIIINGNVYVSDVREVVYALGF